MDTKPKPKLIKGMTRKEYHRNYMRSWGQKSRDFIINPATNAKFQSYYNEYITHKQQEQEPTVEFHEFIIQFFEIGYLGWRSKIKGK